MGKDKRRRSSSLSPERIRDKKKRSRSRERLYKKKEKKRSRFGYLFGCQEFALICDSFFAGLEKEEEAGHGLKTGWKSNTILKLLNFDPKKTRLIVQYSVELFFF